MRKGRNRASTQRAKKPTDKRRRKPIDVAALKALTDSMPRQKEPARIFMRWMRDQARY